MIVAVSIYENTFPLCNTCFIARLRSIGESECGAEAQISLNKTVLELFELTEFLCLLLIRSLHEHNPFCDLRKRSIRVLAEIS